MPTSSSLRSGFLIGYSIFIVSLPLFHATVIRGAGFSLDSAAPFIIMSLITSAALWIALRSLSRTKFQQLYIAESSRLKAVLSKKDQPQMDQFQSSLETCAFYYSLSMISGIFLTVFVFLATGLLASLPTFINFGLSTIVPSMTLAVLTSPRS